jgi:hypothetical protein
VAGVEVVTDFEQLVIDLATRFIEVAEVIKNDYPFNVVDTAEERAESAWYQLHSAEVDWRSDDAS